jgi:hypothetical protein
MSLTVLTNFCHLQTEQKIHLVDGQLRTFEKNSAQTTKRMPGELLFRCSSPFFINLEFFMELEFEIPKQDPSEPQWAESQLNPAAHKNKKS